MRRVFLFIVIINCILPQISFSQNALEGVLTDSITGESLPGVNIFIPEMEKGTLTSEGGKYSITNLSNGTYHVQFRLVEYKTVIRSVTMNGIPVVLNVNLPPIVVETHGIVISTPFSSEQDDNPVEVVQFDKSAIEKVGDPSLMGALATRPGISQISTGINVGKPVIRGLSGNRVVVYSSGVRVENQQWGDEHGLGLTDIGIDKVEVVKGPSTLLYGSDAMGGVIHVIDEHAATVGTIQGDAGLSIYSNTIGASGDFGVKGTGKFFRAGIRAGYKNHADYMTGNGDRASFSRFNETALKGNIGINLPWLISSLRYTYIGSELGIPGEQDSTSGLERDMNITHQGLTNQLIAWQNLISAGKQKIRLTMGYLLNHRMEFERSFDSTSGQNNVNPGLNMDLRTMNYDLKWYLPKMGRLELITGIQGMFQTNKNNGSEILVPNAHVTDGGLLAIAKVSWIKMQIQFGGRTDVRNLQTEQMGLPGQDVYFAELNRQFKSANGAAGFVYKASSKFLIRFNTATGFRSPNLAELHSNGIHEGTVRYEIGDINLRRERNIEMDLGCHYHSEHVTFEISLFNNFIKDYIFISPTNTFDSASGLKIFRYQQGSANLAGGEMGFDLHPHPLDWLHFETTASFVNAQLSTGGYLPLIPPLRITNTLRGEFNNFAFIHKPWITVSGQTVFAQNQIATFETKTPAYFLLNVSLGGKFGNGNQAADISIAMNNLLNESYYDHLSRLKTSGIYNIGRNITVTARIPFELKKKSGV